MDEEVSTAPAEPNAEQASAAEAQPAVQDAAPAQSRSGAEPADEQGLTAEPHTAKEEPDEQTLGAPEGNYSLDGIETPEGAALDEPTFGKLGEICKDLNLSQAAFTRIAKEMTPFLAARQAEQLADAGKAMLAEAKADPEIGGAKWSETIRGASKAYGKFVDPEGQAFFHRLGLDKSIHLIRAFNRIQAAIGDDAVIKGSANARADSAKSFFPNSRMN